MAEPNQNADWQHLADQIGVNAKNFVDGGTFDQIYRPG